MAYELPCESDLMQTAVLLHGCLTTLDASVLQVSMLSSLSYFKYVFNHEICACMYAILKGQCNETYELSTISSHGFPISHIYPMHLTWTCILLTVILLEIMFEHQWGEPLRTPHKYKCNN